MLCVFLMPGQSGLFIARRMYYFTFWILDLYWICWAVSFCLLFLACIV